MIPFWWNVCIWRPAHVKETNRLKSLNFQQYYNLFPEGRLNCNYAFNLTILSWNIKRMSHLHFLLSCINVNTVIIGVKSWNWSIQSPQRNWVVVTTSNFLIPISLQPVGIKPLIFQNIYSLQHWVANVYGLEDSWFL